MRLENDELYLQVKKEKAISGYGQTKNDQNNILFGRSNKTAILLL